MLSRQHISLALRRRAQDFQDVTPPDYVTHVVATVLLPETPLPQRQMFAGDVQAQQGQVKQLNLVEFAELLLETPGEDKQTQLAVAIRKAG